MQVFPGRVSYCLVFAIAVLNAVLIALSPVSLPLGDLLAPATIVALMLGATVVADRYSPDDDKLQKFLTRLGYFLQGLVFLQLAWLSVRVFNHVTMSFPLPYTDALLSGWDVAMGFDWLAYFRFVQENDAVRVLLDYSYESLSLTSFIAFVILMVLPDLRRARYFLETFLVTAVICTAAGMFFPAEAAVAYYLGQADQMRNFATPPGVYHLDHMMQLRSGQPFAMDVNNLPGLVTFPSFHTAAGIILVASFWRTRLFAPVLAYSTVMIASTPIYGGHYFVDLIAGIAVAWAVAWAYAVKPEYAGLFRAGALAQETRLPDPALTEKH